MATTTAMEADRLETAMKSARLSVDQEIAVWDIWQDYGLLAAEHVLTSIKESRTPALLIKVREKARNPLDAAAATLVGALRARYGDDQAADLVRRVTAQIAPDAGVGSGQAVVSDNASLPNTKRSQIADQVMAGLKQEVKR